MNRQLIIRGAAISVAAIAASVFLAGQFLGDNESVIAGSPVDKPAEVRGASIVGQYGTTPSPANMEPAEPELQFSALDTMAAQVASPGVQDGFQPELRFSDEARLSDTPDCAASLAAQPAIDGLIELRLSAPCNAGERVVISHGDLAFTATLDQVGGYAAYIPALSDMAMIDAFLSDDTLLQAQTLVPDHDRYARLVVQWTGTDSVALHAYHNGAAFGEAGHLHAMNPFDPDMEEAFLVTLGDPTAFEPMLAQVYSVPVDQAQAARLQLEFAVTDATCGQDMPTYVMPTQGPDAGQPMELRVAMPACGSGDGLVIVDLPFEAEAATPAALALTADKS